MTRRQFIACLLMAALVLLVLPLEKFREWGDRWFGRAETITFADGSALNFQRGMRAWVTGPHGVFEVMTTRDGRVEVFA